MSTQWIPNLSGKASPDVERAIRIAYENIYQLRGMLDTGKDSKGQTVSNIEILRRLEIAVALVETLLTVIATPLSINTRSQLGLGSGAPGSAPWPAINLGLFVPISINVKTTISKIYIPIGAATSGNIDVGIYSKNGVKLVSSGSTPAGITINQVQVITIDGTNLVPGRYYMALAVDNTTFACISYTTYSDTQNTLLGVKENGGAFPLPATTGLADNNTRAFIPLIGLFTG